MKHLQILPGFGGLLCDAMKTAGIFALWKVKNIETCGVKSHPQRNLPFKKRPKFLAYWNHQLTHLRKHFLTTFSQPGCLSLKAASVWLPNQAKTIRLPGSEMVSKPESAKECKRLQMSTIFQEPFIEPFWCLSCLVAWWHFKSNQNDISDAWFGDAHSALSSEMFAWKQKTSLLVNWMKLHFTGLSIRVLFPIDQILEYHFRHVSYLSNHVSWILCIPWGQCGSTQHKWSSSCTLLWISTFQISGAASSGKPQRFHQTWTRKSSSIRPSHFNCTSHDMFFV